MRPSKDAKRADVNLSCGREWQFCRSYRRVFRAGENIASSYAAFGLPLTIDAMLEGGFEPENSPNPQLAFPIDL
ncbi:hypothetical protein CUJ84_Chr003361 [Rhizobium leguminosarum]|uniref:Uncharacterized protein n=1 Tax=Rhizobium leguminosarum TaxID=384 RepID=A0A2K9Z631_RHILE|nr:hypothetical protein CUJ84_Chr003361 [Rhizobium leguminosarum]